MPSRRPHPCSSDPESTPISKYWDFDPEKKIHYRTDAEYEEHFRTVFAKASSAGSVPTAPSLPNSARYDSSSIVCMADTVIARGAAETPRLTLSRGTLLRP